MIEHAAQLLIGFSIVAAALLLIAGATVYRTPPRPWLSHLAGVVLLGGLAWLQWLHRGYLLDGQPLFASRTYATLLFAVAPAFYLCFRGALQPKALDSPLGLLHFAPAVVAPWLLAGGIAVPLAFVLGVGYASRLAALVFRLRGQRRQFKLELSAFAGFAAIALAILGLGLAAPYLGARAFVLGYATLIGLAFAMAVHLLLRFPDLVGKAADAVARAYAVSTLDKVDCAQALARLQRVMETERIYTDDTLNLARVAEAVALAPHQLSELINTRFSMPFPRYVREHRVRAAQAMLLAEPKASVLSVGLAVGFTSQSNFYAAFREVTGEVPGRFRKNADPAA